MRSQRGCRGSAGSCARRQPIGAMPLEAETGGNRYHERSIYGYWRLLCKYSSLCASSSEGGRSSKHRLKLYPIWQRRVSSDTNTFKSLITALHEDMTSTYDEAMEADRDLSLQVLGSLPEELVPTPGAITLPDREERVNSVNALAAVPMPSPKELMLRARKLQSFFSDKTSGVARHNLFKALTPDDETQFSVG